MSSFGADIFDQEPPPPPPPRRTPPEAAPPGRVEEVNLTQPQRVHDDEAGVVFSGQTQKARPGPSRPPAGPRPGPTEPPAREVREVPPMREAREVPPMREMREAREAPPMREAREAPPMREVREVPPPREARETPDNRERGEREVRTSGSDADAPGPAAREGRRPDFDRPRQRDWQREAAPRSASMHGPGEPAPQALRGRHEQERRPDPERIDDDRGRWQARQPGGGRPERRPHVPPPADRAPRRDEGRQPSGSEPRRPEGAGQRVGIVLDLVALQADAQKHGGELSFRKLLRGIAGERPVIRALCYVAKGSPDTATQALTASGFEVQTHADAETAAVAMAVDAMALAPRIDALVLAPAHKAMPPLVQALRSQGIRIEIASFDGTAPAGALPRRLGRDCFFVP